MRNPDLGNWSKLRAVGGAERGARGKPRELSVICYRLKRESNLKEWRLPSRGITRYLGFGLSEFAREFFGVASP